MNRISHLYLAPLLFLFSLNVYAEEKAAKQFSQEEYQKASIASAEYNGCLNEAAINHVQKQTDVRVVADHAMKDCAPILETLYKDLIASGGGDYEPEAIRRMTTSISNRGANKLVSNVMRYMAMQQSQQQSE